MVPGTRDLFLAQVEASQSLALAHSPATIAVRMFCMVPPPLLLVEAAKEAKEAKEGVTVGGDTASGLN